VSPPDRKQRERMVHLISHTHFKGRQQIGIYPTVEGVCREGPQCYAEKCGKTANRKEEAIH